MGVFCLVGVPRFELGTSRTRTVRSTGLSHTPIADGLYTSPRSLASLVSRIQPNGLSVHIDWRVQYWVHLADREPRQCWLLHLVRQGGQELLWVDPVHR